MKNLNKNLLNNYTLLVFKVKLKVLNLRKKKLPSVKLTENAIQRNTYALT